MKKNHKTDKICIEKILAYIGYVEECFRQYEIKSPEDLEDQKLAQFAITQIITNIYELKKKLTNEILLKLPEFDKIRLANARNIASHDYDSLDFETIYRLCKLRILNESVKNELEGTLKSYENNNDE
ncbi:MAG: hypothetical protein FWG63_00570 [Defluviitaleaceae bacterium]|nr:hypothetical protein [Defluviitaleaceae bacterium]